MEFLIGYLLFSLTTSLAALILLLKPVLYSLKIEQPLNLLLDNYVITYGVFFVMGVIIAPILFLSAIVPHYSEKFRETLLESIKS